MVASKGGHCLQGPELLRVTIRTLTLQVWKLRPAEKKLLERRHGDISCTVGLEGLMEKGLRHELAPGFQEDGLLSRWIERNSHGVRGAWASTSVHQKTDIRIRAVKI